MKPTKSTATGASASFSACSNHPHNIAAIGPLVSHAPRPQMRSSRNSAPKGSTVIPATPTVSRCGPSNTRGRPSTGANLAIKFGRPGRISSNTTFAPAFSRNARSHSAIRASPVCGVPAGLSGLHDGIRMSSRRRSTTECCMSQQPARSRADINRDCAGDASTKASQKIPSLQR